MQFMRDGPYFFKKINIRSPGGEPTMVLQYQPPFQNFKRAEMATIIGAVKPRMVDVAYFHPNMATFIQTCISV